MAADDLSTPGGVTTDGRSPRADPMFAMLLVSMMAVGPYLQLGLSAIAPVLRDELSLSRLQVGLLPATLAAVAATTAWRWGSWVDRVSEWRASLVLFGVACVSFILAALAASFLWLVPAVALAGVAMGGSNLLTNRLILARYRLGHRGGILGVKQAGVNLGILAAGVVLPLAARADAWRGALAASAIIPLVGLVVARRHVVTGASSDDGVHRTRQLLADAPDDVRRGIDGLLAYTLLMGAAVAAGSAYLPLYAFEQLDVTETAAGFVTAVIGATGLTARVFWGRVAERSGNVARSLCVLSLGTLVGVVLIVVLGRLSYGALLPSLVAYAAFSSAWVVVAMLATTSYIPRRWSGLATGRVMTSFYLGYMVGPVAFGWLVDNTGTYLWGWALVVAFTGTALGVARSLLAGALQEGGHG